MYAIIETGGKQYKVEPGSVVLVEKLPNETGEIVEFDRVLVLNNNGNLKVGSPFVPGAKVRGKVQGHNKHKKILVFKYKAKTNYRRRYGHRQPYTKVLVEEIVG